MRVTPLGQLIGGVAGAGVFRCDPATGQTTKVRDGGTATAGGERIYYQGAADARLHACALDGSDEQTPDCPTGLSLIVASSSVWAAWTRGHVTVTSWDGHYQGWVPLLATEDGAVLLMSYPDPGLGLRLVDATGDVWTDATARGNMALPYPQAFALDRHRFCWVEPSGRLRVRGLPEPAQVSDIHDPFLLDAPSGDVWIGYHNSRCIAHPLTDPSRGYILSTGVTFGTSAAGNRVGWGRTQGESVLGYADVDWSVALQDLAQPDDIVSVDRAIRFGFFEFGGPTDCPVNCRLSVEQGAPWLIVRDLDGRPLYRYVAGDPDGDPDAIDRAVATARAVGDGLEVLAYVPRQASAVRLPDAIVGVECYRLVDESVTDFERRIRDVVARCRRAVLIAQCYTSNDRQTKDLRSIPPVVARIARDAANVECGLVFSGSGRATGYQDHPEVQPDWRRVAATIRTPVGTTPPQPIPPGLPQLRVSIDHYTPGGQAPCRVAADYHVEGHGQAALQVYLTLDGQRVAMETDPAGQLATVVTEPGEYRLGAMVDCAGRKAQTGATRIVRVTARPDVPAPPPAPPLVVDNDPAVHLNRTAAADTVRLLYLEVLKREPDPSGLAHYVDALMAGGLDSAGLRTILTNAKED